MTFGNVLQELKPEIMFILTQSVPIWNKIQLIGLKLLAWASYKVGKRNPAIRRVNPRRSYELKSNFKFAEYIESVAIIPTLVQNQKDQDQLLRAVNSIALQVQLVLVVNDGSTYPMPTFLQENVAQVKMVRNGGPALARNAGLTVARRLGAVYALFLDSDCQASETWGANMLNRLKDGSTVAVGGITLSLAQSDSVSLYHDLFGTLNGRIMPDKSLLYAPTCNFGLHLNQIHLLCPNAAFDSSFPSAAFEDVQFCLSLRRAGIRVEFEPSAVMLHDFNLTWDGFARQFCKYGKSEGLLLDGYPEYRHLFILSKTIPCICCTI